MGMIYHKKRMWEKLKEAGEPSPASEIYNQEIEQTKKGAEHQYTKSDIQRMSKAELLEVAKNTGVEGADDMTRAELAEYMLRVFSL